MAKNLRKTELSLESTLEAVLELLGWQAELVRAALRQARQQRPKRRRTAKGKSTGRG